jgi:hypothetical protein
MERTRLLSVEGQTARAVLVQTWMDVFFIRQCLIQFLQFFFRPRSPEDCRGRPGEPPWTTGGPLTTV